MDPFFDEQQQSGGGFDPMSLLRTFWRRKMLFFVPFCLCLAMAVVAIKTMKPIYASSGQLSVKFEGLNSQLLTDPSRRLGGTRNIDNVAYQEMNMLLTSPDFLEKMVLELSLQDIVRANLVAAGKKTVSEERLIELAMMRLESRMKLRKDGARLFRLEVRDPDPRHAHKVATYILERFLEDYRASQTVSSTSTREFLERQLETYQEGLTDAESMLNTYLSGLASQALVNNSINVININDAQTNLAVVRERYDGTDAREIADLAQGIRTLLGAVPGTSRYMSDSIVKSTILEMEGVGLDRQLVPAGTNESQDLTTRLGRLRVRLNTRIEEMVGLEYPSLGFLQRNQVSNFVYFSLFREGTRRVMDRLAADIREFQDFTARQPRQSSRIAELQEDVTTARGLVTRIETEITKQTMNLEASISEIGMQIRIRKMPKLKLVPVEPDKFRLTLMGVVLSIGIGMGLVILAIFLDRSFHSVADIERKLGLTVIGTLPVIQDNHFERKKKVRLLRWVTIILGIIAVGAVGFLVIYPRLG